MTPITYRFIMKSGRKFLVEEFVSHSTYLTGNIPTASFDKGVLVKEVATSSDNPSFGKGNVYKNICFIKKTSMAIDYITTLDSLGLDRLENGKIKYFDI